jgi:hypothetical protein
MSVTAARQIDIPSAEEVAASPAFKAMDDFVNSRALEILREWATSPEIVEIMDEAERIRAADAAREA